MQLKILKPATEAEKTTRTTTDTIIVTPNLIKSWKLPPFQRTLKVNEKLKSIAEEIRNDGGVIPGILTLGVFEGDRWLIDGQHRREAFLISECLEGYVDVRIAHFKTMEEMAEEFRKLNGSINKMRPDDNLKAMEYSIAALQKIRKACPFVGYEQIRRGENSPLLSMGTTIRCWNMATKEVPVSGGAAAAGGTVEVARTFPDEEVPNLTAFLSSAHTAWGKDPEYLRLWGNLNLTMCMWLYRRICLASYSAKSVRVDAALFQKCLTALSADEQYVEWLRGRNSSEVNRAPCYRRIKEIFAKRIEEQTNIKPKFPMPPWAYGSSS